MNYLSIAVPLAGLLLTSVSGHAQQNLYQAKTTSTTYLPPGPWVDVTLVSVNVPAGEWSIVGKATVMNTGYGDYYRCRITAGTATIDRATTVVGEMGGLPPASTLSLTAGRTLTAASTNFKLICQHEYAAPVGVQVIDPDARLVISRVGSVAAK